MPDEHLTGESLEEALRSGDLDGPAHEIVGMVKASEERGQISFSLTDCESWVDLPTDLIQSAVQVGKSACRDHSHPVFRLSLKESDDPAARVLAALMASSARSPTLANQTAFPGLPADPFTAEARLGQGGGLGLGYDTRCVRSCQWDCGAVGFPPWACWYYCSWICTFFPRDLSTRA
jgi:hypothetical protein